MRDGFGVGCDESAPLRQGLGEVMRERRSDSDVTVVGNDSGGAISQVLAAHHPARLGRVVLTNCDMYDDFPPHPFGYFRLLPFIPGSMWILGHAFKIKPLG